MIYSVLRYGLGSLDLSPVQRAFAAGRPLARREVRLLRVARHQNRVDGHARFVSAGVVALARSFAGCERH